MQTLKSFYRMSSYGKFFILTIICLLVGNQNLAAQTFTASSLPISIPDGTVANCWESPGTLITSTISVSGISGNITSLDQVTINLQLSHTWIGDIQVSITPPGSSPINLISRLGSGVCGGNIDFSASNTLSFNGNNTTSIPLENPIPAGNYIPTAGSNGVVGNMSNIIGSPYNGDWILTVQDGTVDDFGQLHFFSIELDPCEYPNYVYTGTGDPNESLDSDSWLGGCVPPLNDPNINITIEQNAVFNYSGSIMGTFINNGTLRGSFNLTGDLVNNGTFNPGN